MNSRFGFIVGDKVTHTRKGWVGIVSDFHTRNAGVLIDLSNNGCVRFRWVNHKYLKKVSENT